MQTGYNSDVQHQYVCVGGTFDGIHIGHEALLHKAFAAGQRVLIGLTSDAYAKSYKRYAVRPYKTRYADLRSWLTRHGFNRRYTIVAIGDYYGPAAKDPLLEAIVLTDDTKARGMHINSLRTKRGLPSLELLVVAKVQAEDCHPISSSRVKQGVIDKTGKLILPDALRDELAVPLGRMVHDDAVRSSLRTHAALRIISVGDYTTKTILESGITPRLMIIDHKVNRLPYTALVPILRRNAFVKKTVISGPGFISREAIRLIRQYAGDHHEPIVLEVTGEEDLLALPAIKEAPLGTVVYYGQPDRPAGRQGLVEVIVTKAKQKEVRDLLHRFVVR